MNEVYWRESSVVRRAESHSGPRTDVGPHPHIGGDDVHECLSDAVVDGL